LTIHATSLFPIEPFAHTSLDLYAFLAVTPYASSLRDLIAMVRLDNSRRQKELDAEGIDPQHSLIFSILSFIDPEYKFVALHFLPFGSALPIYDPEARPRTTYVFAQDRFLHESFEPSSPRLPAFHHTLERRRKRNHSNVFLIALNAEIKFGATWRRSDLILP